MKHVSPFCFCSVLFFSLTLSAVPMTDKYECAQQTAQAYNKPLLLLFVGSDCCRESRELLDLFESEVFSSALKNYFVVCKVDFPEINIQSQAMVTQNAELKKRYNVRSFPSVVLLDADASYITTQGYIPANAEVVAEHLTACYAKYSRLRRQLNDSEATPQLEELLIDAKELGNERLVETIVDRGIDRQDGLVFVIERYSRLFNEGKADSEEGRRLHATMSKYAKSSSDQERMQCAMLRFQGNKQKKTLAIQKVVEPLTELLHSLTEENKDVWKIRYLIAQYLFEQGEYEQAAQFAAAAQKSAPSNYQSLLEQLKSKQ